MSIEFEVGGQKYRAGKMDAMTQFHVVRRLGPLLPALQGIAKGLPALLAQGGGIDALAEALVPVTEIITAKMATLSDADSEYILGACLSVVQRDQQGVWAAVWSKQAARPMFDDIGMNDMLQIAWRVMMGSLRPF